MAHRGYNTIYDGLRVSQLIKNYMIMPGKEIRLYFMLVSLLFFFGLDAQEPKVSAGRIVHLDSFSSRFLAARPIDIWLPPHYSESQPRPVLYMHDGQMLFDSNTTWNSQEWKVDEIISSIEWDEDRLAPIVIGIWNNGIHRQSEYFPEKAFRRMSREDRNDFLQSSRSQGQKILSRKPYSDKYLKFLVHELKPYIDLEFATLSDRKHTYIAGSSYGGLISVYALCEYPEVFGGVIAMSTHWTGVMEHNLPVPTALIDYLDRRLPEGKNHKLYFDHGTEGLDSLYRPYQDMVDQLCIKRSYSEGQWTRRVFQGANHSERAWSQRFGQALLFLTRND